MKRVIPAILWLAVVVTLGLYFLYAQANSRPHDANALPAGDGRVFAEVNWNYLPAIDPFELTDQNGEQFDSTALAGKPYAVSFFYADCPHICAQMNKKIQALTDEFKNKELGFVSITCDPLNDTQEVLHRYANDFGADPDQWKFLTGQMYRIQEIGRQFEVSLDLGTHTDDILIVDRWGRYRDRFKWNDPNELARFSEVARELLTEHTPPLNSTVKTRNVLAGVDHDKRKKQWLNEFFLVDHEGQRFFSRELTGQVWIANFFFSTCTQVCKKQNEYIRGLQDRLGERPVELISISVDPQTDTVEVLNQYREALGVEKDNWRFHTGDRTYVRRVSEEFFRTPSNSGGHHSSKLFVVDRWGNVRGSFDWQEPGAEAEMLQLVDKLVTESTPNERFLAE